MIEMHKSRCYKWDQFNDAELADIYSRLCRELKITQEQLPARTRKQLESAINYMAEEKGRRSLDAYWMDVAPLIMKAADQWLSRH